MMKLSKNEVSVKNYDIYKKYNLKNIARTMLIFYSVPSRSNNFNRLKKEQGLKHNYYWEHYAH